MTASTVRHILHVFSTFAVGGPQRRFADLVDGLGAGYRHTVVAMDGRTEAADLVRHDERLTLVHVPVAKRGGLSMANLRRFRRVVQELRPDMLATYNWGAIEWALANRFRPVCPHVHVEDGFGPEEAGGRQLARRVWCRRLALSGAHTQVVVPSYTLLRLVVRVWRLNLAHVQHIPNGIDCAQIWRSAASGRRERTPGAGVTIGTVAALRPEKNLKRLIRAFADLSPVSAARLLVVGDGPELPELIAEATRLGVRDRVSFPGYIADPGVALGEMDVFALTSDTEQMPCSLMEAMAAGLPVVATDVGDVRQMVSDANRRHVVAVEDTKGLTASLETLARNHGERWSLGAANATKARAQFGWTLMLRGWDAVFQGQRNGVGYDNLHSKRPRTRNRSAHPNVERSDSL